MVCTFGAMVLQVCLQGGQDTGNKASTLTVGPQVSELNFLFSSHQAL